jgi:hypothetical protein
VSNGEFPGPPVWLPRVAETGLQMRKWWMRCSTLVPRVTLDLLMTQSSLVFILIEAAGVVYQAMLDRVDIPQSVE